MTDSGASRSVLPCPEPPTRKIHTGSPASTMLATYTAWTTLVVTLSPSCSHLAYTPSTCVIVIAGASGTGFAGTWPEMLEPLGDDAALVATGGRSRRTSHQMSPV